MIIKGLKIFHGESIFIDKPAVIASIESDINEQIIISEALNDFDDHLHKDFPRSLSFDLGKIPGINTASSFTRCSIYLFSFLLKRFGLGVCELRYQRSCQKIEHIIVAEQNKVVCEQLLFYSILYSSSFLPNSVIQSVDRQQAKKLLYAWIENINQYTKTKSISGLQQALVKLDKPWLALDFSLAHKNDLQIGFGRCQRQLQATVSFDSSGQGVSITQDKNLTNRFLSELGFPFPRQFVISSLKDALSKAENFGYPLVLKCNYGAYGDYVFADLRDAEELTAAYNLLETRASGIYNKKLLLEEHRYGHVYRLEVIYGEPLGCYQMVPASVLGNGKDNIEALVLKENMKPERGGSAEQEASLRSLELGSSEIAYLKKQGLSPDSIPENGKRVQLLSNSNWSSGGTYKVVTNDVHPDNFELMVQLATQLQVDLLGIDVICDDISNSYIEAGFTIIEVNHSPGIFGEQESHSVYSSVSEHLANQLTKAVNFGDVPVINFHESEVSESLMTNLGNKMNTLGYYSGVVHKDRVNINGKYFCPRSNIDHHNPQIALLKNRLIGALLIERSSEELLENGLGSGGCDISVITGVFSNNIFSPVLNREVEQKQLVSFLINCSRLASIIVVDEKTDFDLLASLRANKLFLLSSEGFEQQAISLIEQGARGIELKMSFENHLVVDFHTTAGVEERTIAISNSGTDDDLLSMAVDILLDKAAK